MSLPTSKLQDMVVVRDQVAEHSLSTCARRTLSHCVKGDPHAFGVREEANTAEPCRGSSYVGINGIVDPQDC